MLASAALAILPPTGLDPRAIVAAVAEFLVAASAYWVAAGLALLFFATRRRSGLVINLVIATVLWLILRAIGAILQLLVPCIAPNPELAFGFIVALALVYLLPLRLWQRGLCLAIVALAAGTLAYATRCQVPGEIILAAGLLILGGFLAWLLGRTPGARRLWQRIALPLDNWSARQARTAVTPTLAAVFVARLRQRFGLTVDSLEPLGAAGVHASTPLIVTGHTADGQRCHYFAKIISTQNWLTSAIYELWRWLRLRGHARAGPIPPTLKSLVQYEHYMLLVFADLGVPAPRPKGLFRLERRVYALVSEYLEGVQSLRDVGEVSAVYVTRALEALRRLRDADCAHRDIKASNMMVLPGNRFALVDAAQAEIVAGRRRLAQDLADMLVVLAMHHDPAAVIAMAQEIIGPEGLHDAKRYLHTAFINNETQKLLPVGLTRQLRHLIAQPDHPG